MVEKKKNMELGWNVRGKVHIVVSFFYEDLPKTSLGDTAPSRLVG